jgi:rod shape-determining protein MreC
MIYPPRDNIRRVKRRKRSMIILVGLLVVVILTNIFIPRFFSSFIHTTGLPLLYSRLAATSFMSDLGLTLQSKRTLIEENKALEQKMIVFEAIQAKEQALQKENESLRALMGKASTTPTSILAQILSKPGYSPYDTLIIDAGQKDGVIVGDIVLVDNTLVIGEVVAVTQHTANVLLYSTPEHKTDVFLGSQYIQATAVGKGGGNFEIRVPRNTEIIQGDEVRLAKFPDIVFGSITEVNGTAADTFERVLFRSLIDIAHVRFVTIQKQS